MKKTTTSTRSRAPARPTPSARPPRRSRAATAVADAVARAATVDAVEPVADPAPAPAMSIEADTEKSAGERARKPAVPRRVRQACRLSEDEYARLGALKKRAGSLARPMKRGELLRAGLHVLLRMPDDELFRALDALPAAPAD